MINCLLNRCNVKDDIFSSLAISDCFNFGLTDLISINLAIKFTIFDEVSIQNEGDLFQMFILKKKCYSFRYLNKNKDVKLANKKNYSKVLLCFFVIPTKLTYSSSKIVLMFFF